LLFRLKLKGPGVHTTPSRAVWPVATTNGLASVVPAEEAQIYNRVDYIALAAIRIGDLAEVANTKLAAVSSRLGVFLIQGIMSISSKPTSRSSCGP